MTQRVLLRPAQPDDAVIAASLLHLAMGGTAELFADSESGLSPGKLLAALFTCRGGRFSYQFGTVLKADNVLSGLLISFPASKMMLLDLITGINLLSVLGLRAMIRLTKKMSSMISVHEAERGEYYISNLGVLPDFQGNGYGARLLTFAEEQARKLMLRKCSLTVDEHNDGAIRLYQRYGYEIVFSGKYNSGYAEKESGYHRMVKELA